MQKCSFVTRFVWAPLIVLVCHSHAAVDSSGVPDLGTKMGPGWQCSAIPSGFSKVGVIFERRPDKSVYYLDEIKEDNLASAPVSIGTLTTSTQFSVGIALKLISLFFPSLNFSVSRDKKVTTVIAGAEETVGGFRVEQDAISWAKKNLSAFRRGSKILVVREAISASSVKYAFDESTATAIQAQLNLTAPRTSSKSSSPVSTENTSGNDAIPKDQSSTSNKSGNQQSTIAPPDSSHQVEQTFDPKIGICIHLDEVLLSSGYSGLTPVIHHVTEDLELQ